MEHYLIKEWFEKNITAEKNIISKKNEAIIKLSKYANMIYQENKKYNLTGLDNIDDIVSTLIIKSISPLKDLNVPRGTNFVDIGTGSGIPGVILAICFAETLKGKLIEANNKKTTFIEMVKKELSLDNIDVVNERIEIVSKNAVLRESFDFCVTRAFGPLYYSYEFGMPLVKKDGFLYIYSNLTADVLSKDIKDHISILGGVLEKNISHSLYGINKEGLLVKKINKTPEKYPRNYPVVKREAAKIPETI